MEIEVEELHKFVTDLETGQLYFLISTPPLGDDILDHALSCEECAKKVSQAGEDHWDSLSEKNKALCRESAQRILARFKAMS